MVKADFGRTGIHLHTAYFRGIRKVKVMDNRKEPPFFNEDNVGPLYFKLPFCDTMELSIETLTGTCFELRVSPFEAVISVKGKIQRLEGIPICQQHLIWNNVELEDDYCLKDYNISEGCTLKLVLAMRGGPINTRKVPVEDPFGELAEYVDPTQEEVWEKASCNKQVTFLVYREGDQLNFFRVVDRGDGTLTPLSESLSGGSVYNLYTDEDEDAEPSPSGQQIIENSVTMNKMKLLRAKMENMNLSKKPKKVVKVKPRPPIAPRPSSGSAAARHRLLRVLPHIGQSCLPSPGSAHHPETSRNVVAGSATHSAADRPTASLRSDPLKQEDNWETYKSLPHPGGSSSRQPPKAHTELQPKELADSAHLPRWTKHFPGNSPPREDQDDAVLLPTSEEGVPKDSPLPEVGPLAACAEGHASEPSGGFEPHAHGRGLRAAARALGEVVDAGLKRRLLSPLRPAGLPALPAPASASAPLGSLRPTAEPPFSRTARFRGVKVDSPGKRPDVISKVEARDITEMANKACKEPVGCVNNSGLLASLTRSSSRDGAGAHSTRGPRLRPSGIPLPLQSSPAAEHADGFLSSRGIGMNGNNAAAGKRVGESTHRLPPVKTPLQTKKKITKHCFLCGKKTGLATSFECRCGNNFCASHRYAETHGCTYDYKSAGRRYLQEANPVVNAPKLPKI
uniref:AN1-type zinc finger protein 4 n=1 Tax=Jaculus jaculus TaxID=51337 RepID=UPI001E1B5494|nr:AN1-type zinc finger protein 4 [Jaculus jaculus]